MRPAGMESGGGSSMVELLLDAGFDIDRDQPLNGSCHAAFVAHPNEVADIIALAAASLDVEAQKVSPLVLTAAY
jgi:hypothetical protein